MIGLDGDGMALEELGEFFECPDDDGRFLLERVIVTLRDRVLA
jgi:hypothetical protein